MFHFVTEMCMCVHLSVSKWCIVGCRTSALWDLWDWSIRHVSWWPLLGYYLGTLPSESNHCNSFGNRSPPFLWSSCHSPQTTFSSNSTCCVLSTQKSAMHVVVYAERLTTQHSIVDIVHWSWSYCQFCYPRWHVECFWAALAAHWISSASHTSVLPQHPRRKIVPYRVGWNHHTSDYYG